MNQMYLDHAQHQVQLQQAPMPPQAQHLGQPQPHLAPQALASIQQNVQQPMASALAEDIKASEPQGLPQAPQDLPQQAVDNGLAAADGGAGSFKKQNEATGVEGGGADQGIVPN